MLPLFQKNGYKRTFFDKVLSSFEKRHSSGTALVASQQKDFEFNQMIKITFIGSISHEFKNKLPNLFFKDLNIEIFPIFTTTKLPSFIPLKSRTPKDITSNFVYKFTCLCEASLVYIGKTKRHLGVNSQEHLYLEKENPLGEIKTHFKSCVVCRKSIIEDFQIIKKCLNDQYSKINEAIIIKKENP